MKNKKGFTLMELLSVIVLLGIIITIGLFSISSIRKAILDRQYKNLKTEIELAAEKYYQDTENTFFYVQTLIDEGYIKTDNSSLNIYSPIDSKIMNCYTINIVDGKATIDDKNKNEECNAEIAGNYELKIVRENDKTSDKWYKESEILSAVIKSDNSVDDSLIYTWTTDLNPNTIWDKRKFDLKNLLNEKGGVINDVFYVQANSVDKSYRSAGKRIKIDKVKPIIDSADAGEQNDWVKQRDVTIKAHDLGSGIVGYLFSDKADCFGNFEKLTKPQNEFTLKRTFKSNGEYYFCLIDDAGNISESSKIVIQKVDGIPPKCYYSGESTEYIKGKRVITYGCIDDESGCATLKVGSATSTCDPSTSTNCSKLTNTYSYKDTTITDKITNKIGSFTIIDKNGNKTDCPIVDKTKENYKENLNIYLDNTNPTVKINSMSYSGGYLTVSASVTDSNSGVQNAYVVYNGKTSNTVPCNGNCTLRLYVGSLVSENVTLYGTDKVGNVGSDSKTINVYTGTKSDSSDYNTSFTANISYSGTYLYHDIQNSLGSASCSSSGRCTISPKSTSESCTLKKSPNTSEPDYDSCEDGGSLNRWGECDADDQYFTNYDCVCTFSNGTYNGDNFYCPQIGCVRRFGERWTDREVTYCCSNCLQDIDCSDSPYVCYNIAAAPNFGDYSGPKKVSAEKRCTYDSYKPNMWCSGDETLIGSTCYSCDRGGYLSETTCYYSGTCTVYSYKFSYEYYSYS
jgi:prepilin-type N-terminal cleavage/methylation domain-containing protein